MDHPEHDKPSAATRRVEMADFRDDVAGYLRQVREGASFVITWDDEVVAELHPPSPPPKLAPREPGRMRGKIWMADDFDTWPEGFIDEMVNGPIFPPEDKGG